MFSIELKEEEEENKNYLLLQTCDSMICSNLSAIIIYICFI